MHNSRPWQTSPVQEFEGDAICILVMSLTFHSAMTVRLWKQASVSCIPKPTMRGGVRHTYSMVDGPLGIAVRTPVDNVYEIYGCPLPGLHKHSDGSSMGARK